MHLTADKRLFRQSHREHQARDWDGSWKTRSCIAIEPELIRPTGRLECLIGPMLIQARHRNLHLLVRIQGSHPSH
jgi:hypothetical protein